MWTFFFKQIVVTGPLGAVGTLQGRLGFTQKHATRFVKFTLWRVGCPHGHANSHSSIKVLINGPISKGTGWKMGHFIILPGFTTNQKLEQHIYQRITYAVDRVFHLSRTLLDGSHQRLVRNQSAGVEFGEGASLAQTRYCTWPLMLLGRWEPLM